MQITNTTALKKLRKLKKRYRVAQGGSSAGKTICILLILIDYALKNPGQTISVVAGTVPAIRRGAMKDFFTILKSLNRYKESQHNKSLMRYTFTNGSYIEFFSTDDSSRLRGARRHVLFCNEANTIPGGFDAFQELAIRTENFCFLDFNPTSLFWVHKELIGQPDTDFITLTYRDNESLSQNIVDELLKAREKAKTSNFWRSWCSVYLDGLPGKLEGVCIPDWKPIDHIPSEARLIGYGLDFGFSLDPSVLIAGYKLDQAFIFDEILYKKGMLNRDISHFMTQNNITETVIADSAEPKSISELQSYGHKIFGVSKGRDSVVYGINLINQNEIYITNKSINLKKELEGYVWAKDKDGNTIQKPSGVHPDCIDAMRYLLTDHLQNPNKGKYYIY